MKLVKGIVSLLFICLSVHRGEGGGPDVTITLDTLELTVQGPSPTLQDIRPEPVPSHLYPQTSGIGPTPSPRHPGSYPMLVTFGDHQGRPCLLEDPAPTGTKI